MGTLKRTMVGVVAAALVGVACSGGGGSTVAPAEVPAEP